MKSGNQKMRAIDQMSAQMKAWADRVGVNCVNGSKRTTRWYAVEWENNLFFPMTPEIKQQFEDGDGNELGKKMASLMSSSALSYNVFAAINSSAARSRLLQRLTGGQIQSCTSQLFEAKFPVLKRPANLDAIFHVDCNGPVKAVAVECKFMEPYQGGGKVLADNYKTNLGLWDSFPACKSLAAELCADKVFRRFDACQILKHIAGLTKFFGPKGFALAYVWYDLAGTREAKEHRDELQRFQERIQHDPVNFVASTWQELFSDPLLRNELTAPHLAYLQERYFQRHAQ